MPVAFSATENSMENLPVVRRISIAKDFTETPGGRRREEHGKPGYSGEELRENLLKPALKEAMKKNGILEVDFDGIAGCAASFLSEAFAFLVFSLAEDIQEKTFAKVRLYPSENDDAFDKRLLHSSIRRAKRYIKRHLRIVGTFAKEAGYSEEIWEYIDEI